MKDFADLFIVPQIGVDVTCKELYQHYVAYQKNYGKEVLGKKMFNLELTKLGFTKARGTHNKMVIKNIKLRWWS